MRSKRLGARLGIGIAVLVSILFLSAHFIQEPLRRYMESRMNESLAGYSVQLESLDFHPIGLSVTLRKLKVIQDAHPEPPIADIPYLHASVHWSRIIHATLVSDFELRRPRVYVNLKQLQEEISDEQPIDERGWQDTLRAIYPIELDLLIIRNGNFVYIDEDPQRPLRVEEIFFEAKNIRNIRSPEEAYPSPIRMEAMIFGKGRAMIEGSADFLKEPHPGIKAGLELTGVPLNYLRPILERHDLTLTGGELSASGEIEHSPKNKNYQLETVDISGIKIDYRIPGEDKGKQGSRETASGDQENESGLSYAIEKLNATGTFGMVDTTTDPQYRLFLDNVELEATGISSELQQRRIQAELSGDFMGSGKTNANAVFRPEKNGPDFDINLRIGETSLPSMNNLLKAYGNFDVAGGTFSLTTEIQIENNRIDGYIKPIFKDLDVYSSQQEEQKDITQKTYEGLVSGMVQLFEHGAEDQIATRTDLSGKVQDPEASTWQIVTNLFRNAFVEAILPSFEAGIPD